MNNNNASNPTIQELGHSPDALTQRKAELMALLAQAAPELISDQQLNVTKLQEILGEERLAADEHYELSWAGKAAARREIQKTSSHTLRPDANNPAQAQHMLIEGENLEVLRVLQKSYYGKVKMIYIDPPYNTGNDSFVYPDNYSETLDEYQRRTGEKNEAGYLNKQSLWKKNSKESGQYHSAWLSMIYPRLYLARNLLRDDGVIFISIDDNEAANLKLLCDEVFGAENFVADFIWQHRKSSQNDVDVSLSHNHTLCFSKKRDFFRLNPLEIDSGKFDNPDSDPRGPWVADPFDAPNIRPNLTYPITNPITGENHMPPNGRCWRFSQDKFAQALSEQRIVFGKNGKGRPQFKRFQSEAEDKGTNPFTVWTDTGTATEGTKELMKLFGGIKIFDTPKPVRLINEILKLSVDENSIVLDFFAGSGTAAHALMELNLDGGKRTSISVQMPEVLEEDSEGYKAGYRTIADITRARIDKVIAKLKAEHTEKTADLACAYFTLAPSNFKVWQGDVNSSKALREQLSMFQSAEKGDGGIGNALKLSDEQLLTNLQAVQKANVLALSSALVPSTSDNGKQVFCPLNFTIEMETGTGKTYTFIKTMYELNKVYGFKKFVVVVPSVAIREGTMKNLQITRSHFAADYANVPCVPILYNGDKLTELRHFAQSDALSVLVINIDSFTKDNNKIKQKGERAFAPIEYIKAVNPIVIVDEPQNFETDVRRSALMDLNPLCTLRYSATHKNPYNLLYSLNPVQAYDLGLVKQIEVDGVLADDDQNQAFVELVSIDAKAKGITAKVRIDVNDKSGPKRKELTLKLGDDLYAKSSMRDLYLDGYILNEIRAGDGEIEFSGGRVLRVNEAQGGLTDDVMRFQIERTVAAHFAKLKNVQPIGVKVLSLFFIDKVANYRAFDDEGNAVPGKFAQWFEDAFNKYANKAQYRGLITHAASEVHDGYFSGDKKGKGAKAKTVWVDTSGSVAKDDSTYSLIMKDKERLLSADVPLQFIFSHSALREGWDNPNVFQICTLNETKSAMKKRQEIGRGLRLCVNKNGERVQDKRVNVLTVIPNESYEAFAKALQQEIEDETGVSFEKRIKNARAKARIQRKALTSEEEALFKAIWNKISYQTRYSVQLDTPSLIKTCVQALGDTTQYPKVRSPKIRAEKGTIVMRREGVEVLQTAINDTSAREFGTSVPDVYVYIQNRVHLSRSTIFSILDGSGRLDELMINPQAFLDTAISAIKTCLQTLMVEGIEYHTINGRRYEMSLFDEELETYLSSVYPPADDDMTTPVGKTLLQAQRLDEQKAPVGDPFSCVLSDSDTESQFAHDCSVDERVKFFFKLPSRFKIPTPLGTYNPDWAVVLEDDARVYFVAETKSTTVKANRRPAENLQIACGRKHFELADGVAFKDVPSLEELTSTAAQMV